jgi:hypothetical protein
MAFSYEMYNLEKLEEFLSGGCGTQKGHSSFHTHSELSDRPVGRCNNPIKPAKGVSFLLK